MDGYAIIIAISIAAAIVTCDLINIDNHWASTSTFHRDHDHALIGHVIKTLPLFITDCLIACQETVRCFSVNYANYNNGTFTCELNSSNKKQRKDSFVRKEGFEYAEPPEFQYCDGNFCSPKEVSADGWYQFNASQFKIFYDKKSWSQARAHCQSIGGDLVSFGSRTEYQFVRETIFYPDFLMNRKYEEYNLINGASIVTKDNRRALYFDGANDQATVPSVDFHTTDFTLAFWFKNPMSSYNFFNLINDERNPSTRMFTIYCYHSAFACPFFNVHGETINPGSNFKSSEIPLNQWNHLAFTWDRLNKRFKIYHNANLNKSVESPQGRNVDLRNSGYNTFQVGHNKGGKPYKGWLSDIVILPHALKQPEIKSLQDGNFFGAWVGLNDIDLEGTLKWSDGTPLTYKSAVQNQHLDKDCVYLRKDSHSAIDWNMEKCDDVHPFICEKN